MLFLFHQFQSWIQILLYTCDSLGIIQPKAGQQINSTDFPGAHVDSEVI